MLTTMYPLLLMAAALFFVGVGLFKLTRAVYQLAEAMERRRP